MMQIRNIHTGKEATVKRREWETGKKYKNFRKDYKILNEGDPVVLISVDSIGRKNEVGVYDRDEVIKLIEKDDAKYSLKEIENSRIKPAITLNKDLLSKAEKKKIDNSTNKIEEKLYYALSHIKNDAALLEEGYRNQGLIGYTSNFSEKKYPVLKQIILNHPFNEYFYYFNEEEENSTALENAISDPRHFGYLPINSKEEETIPFFRYVNHNTFSHFYCTNPRVDLLEEFGYEHEIGGDFKNCRLFSKKGGKREPVYVYSKNPDILLFTPLQEITNFGRDSEPKTDTATEIDELDRSSLVESINKIINNLFDSNFKESYTILLNGEWGSGKSSILNFIKGNLKEKFILIDYNAWENQEYKDPWWIIINTISKKASEDKRNKNFDSHKYWRYKTLYKNKFIAALILIIFLASGYFFITDSGNTGALFYGSLIGIFVSFISGITGLVNNFFYKDLNKDELKERFSEHPFKPIQDRFNVIAKNNDLAIFIDDLDRCNIKTTVKIMEGIQNLFKGQRVLYFIASDGRWISNCFNEHYKDFQKLSSAGCSIGDKFLQKCIQLTVNVPKIRKVVYQDFAKTIINGDVLIQDTETPSNITEYEDNINSDSQETSSVSNATTNNINEENQAERVYGNIEHYLNRFLENDEDLLPQNPRQLKRFINQYIIMREILKTEGTLEKYQDSAKEEEKSIRYLIFSHLFPTLKDKIKLGYISVDDIFDDNEERILAVFNTSFSVTEKDDIKLLLNKDITDKLIRGDFYSI